MNAWSYGCGAAVAVATAAVLLACGDDSSSGVPTDAGVADASTPDVAAEASVVSDGGAPIDATADAPIDPTADATPDAARDSGLPSDRFATSVVSVTYGGCAGFGQSSMPGVVLGPPVGGGTGQGGLDVVSLGRGGEIVLKVGTPIVDGPGTDFIVFENAFYLGGDTTKPYAEPGEVSVSADGVAWRTFPCSATSYPYGSCAGWHPVVSAPGNGVSPIDPEHAGGDLFDLADLPAAAADAGAGDGGAAPVQYVRIRDIGSVACASNDSFGTNGFDLDAVAVVNTTTP